MKPTFSWLHCFYHSQNSPSVQQTHSTTIVSRSAVETRFYGKSDRLNLTQPAKRRKQSRGITHIKPAQLVHHKLLTLRLCAHLLLQKLRLILKTNEISHFFVRQYR